MAVSILMGVLSAVVRWGLEMGDLILLKLVKLGQLLLNHVFSGIELVKQAVVLSLLAKLFIRRRALHILPKPLVCVPVL